MALDGRPSLFLLLSMTRSSSQSGSDVIYVDLSVSAVSLTAYQLPFMVLPVLRAEPDTPHMFVYILGRW